MKNTEVDWFCPKCNIYVSSESVTFEETHEFCNTSVVIKEETTLEELSKKYKYKFEQETLEEAAERIFNIPEEKKGDVYFAGDIANLRKGFKFGAKWQQERMYSEEEVIEFTDSVLFNKITKFLKNPKEVLQQFKNK